MNETKIGKTENAKEDELGQNSAEKNIKLVYRKFIKKKKRNTEENKEKEDEQQEQVPVPRQHKFDALLIL